MKNAIFIVTGLSVVGAILVITFLYEQPSLSVTPEIDEGSGHDETDEPSIVLPDTEDENDVSAPAADEITSVQIFFGSSKEDPDTRSCEVVYPVTRDIEPTLAVAKEAIDQLLAGVTDDEDDQGYFTSINTQARVETIVVEQGTATVEFSEEFADGLAGSCKVAAVRAQVEETLLALPMIDHVIIKIDGVPDEEVLQP